MIGNNFLVPRDNVGRAPVTFHWWVWKRAVGEAEGSLGLHNPFC
jgi:hypothetical protein